GNLKQAIACYQEALRVVTESSYPRNFAKIHLDLAIANTMFPPDDDGRSLPQAIVHCETALRVYTKEQFPYEWAWTISIRARTHWLLASQWRPQWNLKGLSRDACWQRAQQGLQAAAEKY